MQLLNMKHSVCNLMEIMVQPCFCRLILHCGRYVVPVPSTGSTLTPSFTSFLTAQKRIDIPNSDRNAFLQNICPLKHNS